MKPFVVAMSGASGAVYGLRLVRALAEAGHEIFFTMTDAARLVIREELGIEIDDLTRPDLLDAFFEADIRERVQYVHYKDLLAPIASGSFPVQGMIVIPCSMSMLAHIAQGTSDDLVERTADVMIKERRKLVLVPRETPLSAIHLENMLKLSRLGVDIVPACPAFYGMPKRLDDLVDFMAGKILDLLGVDAEMFRRWKADRPVPEKPCVE